MGLPDKVGRCKLTHTEGIFVKSHLLPKSVTRFPGGGAFAETDGKIPWKRTFDSWYDTKLVTLEGENILTEYDTYAIQNLKRHNLFAWKRGENISDKDFDIIELIDVDPDKIKLFGLSLLWRAAATSIEAFQSIYLSPAKVEVLREMLIARDPGSQDCFPTYLSAFSDRVAPGNAAPIRWRNFNISFFRFFLNGLVVLVGTSKKERNIRNLRSFALTTGKKPLVFLVPFSGSFQENEVRLTMNAHYHHGYPKWWQPMAKEWSPTDDHLSELIAEGQRDRGKGQH
jgi:hypothetical protein